MHMHDIPHWWKNLMNYVYEVSYRDVPDVKRYEVKNGDELTVKSWSIELYNHRTKETLRLYSTSIVGTDE